MFEIFEKLFVPPPCPAFDLGWSSKVTGLRESIEMAFKQAYFTGVKDGFLIGSLWPFAVALILLLLVWWKTPTRTIPHA